MRHTPGKWNVSHGGTECSEGFSIVCDNAQEGEVIKRVGLVAECWPCTVVDEIHREELAANARLIAAAPELLEACKRAAPYVLNCPFEHSLDAYQALCEAIDKATGDAEC